MEDHPGRRVAGGDRIGQRIGDQLGAQLISHRKPDDAAGGDIDDRRQEQPPLPGRWRTFLRWAWSPERPGLKSTVLSDRSGPLPTRWYWRPPLTCPLVPPLPCDAYVHVVEEIDSSNTGPVKSLAKADMVYFEYPNGGAVFSVGSISWDGSLSYNNYSNTVSRITDNVLKRFSSDQPLPGPTATTDARR